jgi:hypothetical protein
VVVISSHTDAARLARGRRVGAVAEGEESGSSMCEVGPQ